jgi:hypothetical protein
MKIVTSVTIWNDAIGKRISITYSEIDPETGKIIADNKRIDRIITDTSAKKLADDLQAYAQTFVDSIE